MEGLNIYNAGFYHSMAQHHIQKAQHLLLLFNVDGLEYFSPVDFEVNYSAPFCYMFFPGDTHELKYNEKRKNWVVQFDCSGMQCISSKQFSFACGSKNIILPRYLELTRGDIMRWKNKFEALISASMSPIPHEQMLTQLYLLELFGYYIETVIKRGQTCPATKLKQLLDMPENIHISLPELSEKCDYSIDHLRVLFKNKYGISPQEYRIRCTMIYAMELICKSNLFVSDISAKCGFEYLSHFSALFKKTHGMAPREALKRFRYQ